MSRRVVTYLIRKINHTGEEVEHMPHLIHTWRLQLALRTRVLHRKGDLTLHPLELFHKLAAVLLCDTCKLHCTKEHLPSATVTVSLPPLFQAILNGFLFATGVVLVAEINHFWGKAKELQDGFAFARSLSTDVFSEEDSVPLTHCNGDKRRDTSELMLQLTTPSATVQLPYSASYEQNTSTHAHSQCTGCERTGSLSLTAASDLLWTTFTSPACCCGGPPVPGCTV